MFKKFIKISNTSGSLMNRQMLGKLKLKTGVFTAVSEVLSTRHECLKTVLSISSVSALFWCHPKKKTVKKSIERFSIATNRRECLHSFNEFLQNFHECIETRAMLTKNFPKVNQCVETWLLDCVQTLNINSIVSQASKCENYGLGATSESSGGSRRLAKINKAPSPSSGSTSSTGSSGGKDKLKKV